MQAIERPVMMPDWIAILIFSSLFFLVALKILDTKRFYGSITSLINLGGVMEAEIQEKKSFFSLYDFCFTVFSVINITLVLYLINQKYQVSTEIFYIDLSYMVLGYLFGRFLLEYSLVQVFKLTTELKPFLIAKKNYLYAISVAFWALSVIYLYGNQSVLSLLILTFLLFITRWVLLLNTNKKLIVSKLFYFILYLCAFEIAPLLIIYKLITQ